MNEIKSTELIQDSIDYIKIMIVDDDAIVREGLNSLLERNGEIKVVALASSGEEALHILEQQDLDIVLMDIKMPGFGGIEATKRITLFNPSTKVLALSAYNNESHPSEIVHHGAKGYLTKGVSYQEMCEAIKTVHNGSTYVCNAVSDKIRSNLNLGRDLIFNQLNDRELKICKEIIFGSPVEQISQAFGISIKETNHIKDCIYSKLDISNDIALMHLAIRNGFIDQIQ
jgi:two-component system invasion response regulator UvrY